MINAKGPFKYYKSGIFDSQYCDEQVNHAVLAVGFGQYKDS